MTRLLNPVLTALLLFSHSLPVYHSIAIMTQYQYEFLVSIPDRPGVLPVRMSLRPRHLAKLGPRVEAGQVVFGGAMLSREPAKGEGPNVTGSVMLVKANSEDEVRQIILDDAYAADVWDLGKVTITPFKCAVRTAI
ncbi:hypothetical protein ABOM_003805 [Aspergillus bombycis]|uniref:YCII-related domain-containing protein n=1 Tax=Aspergillus bombycis TaxID=109264 RepID=A0A1F8A6K3_9EURO|nr:hypothetical protein ABOM_003805 [Aspergillus bombycis]OGM47382.1 hypothetical protein ABOM_003805 [Aspergillus bombycis]